MSWISGAAIIACCVGGATAIERPITTTIVAATMTLRNLRTERDYGTGTSLHPPPVKLRSIRASTLCSDTQNAGGANRHGQSIPIILASCPADPAAIVALSQQLTSFGAELNNIAFKDAEGASRKINAWIGEKTRGKIKKGLDPKDLAPIGSDKAVLVTVDALYFKADWGSKFVGAETKELPFRTKPGQSVQTPLMHQRSLLRYSENTQLRYLELPYAGGAFTMLVLLPKEDLSIRDQLALVQEDTMDKLQNSVAVHEVDVLFPKFAFSNRGSLRDVLMKLGVRAAFDRNAADFVAMIVTPPADGRIYISQMYYDAWIEVDESGTRAAAATTGIHHMGCGSPKRPPRVDFHADHPFLFFIVHNESRSVLLAGWIAEPKVGK